MTYSIAFLVVLLNVACAANTGLGPYKVSDVTVSGFSAGGFMAVQMHVAYSSVVNGSAVFAGGPFYCAQGTTTFAENKCMQTTMGLPNVNQLIGLTNTDYMAGLIDRPNNMLDDRVYLFSGADDTVVDPKVVDSLQSYYSAYVRTYNIVADYAVPAEHTFPTLTQGGQCSSLASPYIGKCNFDGAGTALQALYYNSLQSGGQAVPENLFSFDQTAFFTNARSSIGDTGYIYVPTACQQGASCHLHVAFHACGQDIDSIGDKFASITGFNDWAEANNFIVLYPFVKKSQSNPVNPQGCWDWWGYTNDYYGVQQGVQMQFARSLIKAVSGL
eukprot:scaffold2831_cov249-Ochromonas_danica.AAC.21